MAVFVIQDAHVRLGATSSGLTNLSDHVRSVSINYTAEMNDKTAMGSSARKRIPGLKDYTVSLEVNMDYASGSIDDVLFPLLGSTGGFMIINPHTSAVGAGNPQYTGAFQLATYSPITGQVGALATNSISLQGDGLLSRSTASTT